MILVAVMAYPRTTVRAVNATVVVAGADRPGNCCRSCPESPTSWFTRTSHQEKSTMKSASAALRNFLQSVGRGTSPALNTSSRGHGVSHLGLLLVSGMLAAALLAGCSNGDSSSTGVLPAGGTDTTGTGLPGGGTGTPPATTPAGTAAVTVGNIFFTSGRNGTSNPAVDTVAVGGTVTWTWGTTGSVPHSIQSVGSPSFTSSSVQSGSGSTYQLTFAQPGTYQYDCAIHGSLMTGTIVVLPAAAAPPTTTAPTTGY
jgi:plastocyanin